MSLHQRDILSLIHNLSSMDTVLEMLMEFERTLDHAGVFAYRNWESGELVEGPTVDRYWFETTWMWPLKLMPDPDGAQRLLNYDCRVSYRKSVFVEPVKVLGPEDREPDVDQPQKSRTREIPVWLVTIAMPRRFVDDSHEGVFELAGEEIDISDIEQAWDGTDPTLAKTPDTEAEPDTDTDEPEEDLL